MEHNFGFTTRYEIIDPSGKTIKKVVNKYNSVCTGTIEQKVYSEKGDILHSHKQPVRSFTVGFLEAFVNGYRLRDSVPQGARALPALTGDCSVNSKVYVQQITLIHPHISFSDTTVTSGILYNNKKVTFDSITVGDSSVKVSMHIDLGTMSAAGSISEIALYSQDGAPNLNSGYVNNYKRGMIAREVFENPYVFESGNSIIISWDLFFETSVFAALTLNWLKNFVQNTVGSDVDITTINGTNTTLSATPTANLTKTFTKEENVRGGIGEHNKGIVLGSSADNVSCTDYHLHTLIEEGSSVGSLHYLAMGQTSNEPVISPVEGIATVTYHREFQNTSAADVIINEAGLVADAGENQYLLARWKLNGVVLNSGYTIRVYFEPTIVAEKENHSIEGLTNDVIIVDDATRQLHPSLRNVSMIQKTPVGTYTWAEAQRYAANLTFAGYSDWRLPICFGGAEPDDEQHQALIILQLYGAQMNLPSSGQVRYWTATEKEITTTERGKYANFIQSNNGSYDWYYVNKTGKYYVFCVR